MRFIITGATGWLARCTASYLKKARPGACIVGTTRSSMRKHPLYDEIVSADCLANDFTFLPEDVLIHAAFCRESDVQKLLESLQFSRITFSRAAKAQIAGIINVSSQAVYGSNANPRNDESVNLNPEYPYALAKVLSEDSLRSIAQQEAFDRYTSLRLASLIGVFDKHCPTNVLSKFINAALEGDDLFLVGGGQKFSFLDIEDAARAIASLVTCNPCRWSHAYNVTLGSQVGIVDLANLVTTHVAHRTKQPAVAIHLQESPIVLSSGGSNARLCEETGWKPVFPLEKIIDECILFEMSKRTDGSHA